MLLCLLLMCFELSRKKRIGTWNTYILFYRSVNLHSDPARSCISQRWSRWVRAVGNGALSPKFFDGCGRSGRRFTRRPKDADFSLDNSATLHMPSAGRPDVSVNGRRGIGKSLPLLRMVCQIGDSQLKAIGSTIAVAMAGLVLVSCQYGEQQPNRSCEG